MAGHKNHVSGNFFLTPDVTFLIKWPPYHSARATKIYRACPSFRIVWEATYHVYELSLVGCPYEYGCDEPPTIIKGRSQHHFFASKWPLEVWRPAQMGYTI